MAAPAAVAAPLPTGTGKITYTSGSTGAPKGVCLGNARLLRQAAALAEAVGIERPRHLSLLPLPVLLENVAGAYAALLAGGEVLLPDLARIGLGGSSSVEPRRLLAALGELQPQTLILIPELLQLLVRACEGAGGRRRACVSSRLAGRGSRRHRSCVRVTTASRCTKATGCPNALRWSR